MDENDKTDKNLPCDNYSFFYDRLIKDKGVIHFMFSIDEAIEEISEKLKSLKESKKDGKTHIVEMCFRTGITIRLDGNEQMFKEFQEIDKRIAIKNET